jgi:hypothetical protein
MPMRIIAQLSGNVRKELDMPLHILAPGPYKSQQLT